MTTTTATPETTPPPPVPDSPNIQILGGRILETGTRNQAVLTRLEGAFAGDVVWGIPNVHGLPPVTAIGWFEGTVAGCGSGGTAMAVVAHLPGGLRWEVMGGTGTGDLVALAGHGVGQWSLDTDSGSLAASITCAGPIELSSFTSTLINRGGQDTLPAPVESVTAGFLPGTRLVVGPEVLPGYPGITFSPGSVPLGSFGVGFESEVAYAFLASPGSAGVGNVYVGILWEQWPDRPCPDGRTHVIVGRNWFTMTGGALLWQSEPSLSCGLDDSGSMY